MSSILFKRPTMLALAGVVTLMSLIPTAEAQYRRPYGYYNRRRGGWRNIYLLAIILPIVFFALILLFWMFVFRKLLARRRQRHAEVLPSHTSSTMYPQTGEYSNPYTGGNAGYDNNTYNYGQQQTTQYPQQAHVSTGHQQYAPPPGKPPQGY
ncbi:hypothetical protein HD553DRAFT_351455 [Filobasidium floriforme]|uniref:uncharacterized protein n=1 Tax=Filobasidium floriforme TaxID=5210 RepID=UPI001E8DDEBC|nr:uncharacterized protein HD553DRAFT_351455 [Filobasidium floriforme]KAH8081936.1 hypothetical protein HD553DRAFT_351455 [Filobasidium floriforme]